MRTPPIDWEDLVAMGMDAATSISAEGASIACVPSPPRLVHRLLMAAAASPPPEGDRMAYMRHVRDLLMGCTDWTQSADTPLTKSQQAEWATYRQALRDLSQEYSGEGPIPWPTAP